MRFLFTFLLLSATYTHVCAQTTQTEVKVLNYSDLTTIGQFNKLELGVRLPDDVAMKVKNFVTDARVKPAEKINPFLQWELDVEAEMVHAETGTVKKIPGFFYREYERDETVNTWIEVQTEYTMRIRFAPPLPGKWKCTISVKAKDKQLPAPAPIDFTVVASANKGFITAHPNKHNFQLNGEIVYPVGNNFPSPMKDVNIYHMDNMAYTYSPAETHKATRLSEWMQYHRDIEAYSRSGGRFIRTLQSGWGSLLEFEKKGNYYDRQPYAWEQDRLLEFCEQNGVYMLFNLMEQEPFMKYGNYHMYDWDWSHYNSKGEYNAADLFPQYCYANGKAKEPYEMFMLEDDLRYHEQRTRYYIARYGYSTSIYLFELLSEPWHLGQIFMQEEPFIHEDELGEKTRAAVKNYHERMAGYIKNTLGHTNQLVGIALLPVKYFESEKLIDQSIYNPNIDVISFNPYSPIPNKLVISKSAPNNEVSESENTMARTALTLGRKTGKIIVISEGGPGDGFDACDNYSQLGVDMMTFGFTGVAAYHAWIGFAKAEEPTWLQVVRGMQHMNTPAMKKTLSGNWVQGRQSERDQRRDAKKGKELQYFIAENQQSAAGYVRNYSYNFFTKGKEGLCTSEGGGLEAPMNALRDMKWDEGKPLYVEGLQKTNYEILWYDRTGAVIATQCQKPRRGKMRLEFPELTVTEGKPERPVVWFTMEAKSCN